MDQNTPRPIGVSRNTHAAPGPTQHHQQQNHNNNASRTYNSQMRAPQSPKKPKLVMVGVISAAIIAVFVAGMGITMLISNISATLAVKSSGYQAVFLSNNMVYFGKISDINDKFITLRDIYYLQVAGQGQNQQQKEQNLSLTKLGNELHGPEDKMYINRSEVLFWENLKADGKVSQAIKDFQNKK